MTGYEIHLGRTERGNEAFPCFELISQEKPLPVSQEPTWSRSFDGAINHDGLVWGTYIHGVFDRPEFRRAWLNRVRVRKHLPPLEGAVSQAVSSRLEQALDRWADHLGVHLNMNPILSALDIPKSRVS
ncbi:MAG: hypothetical protein R3B74_03185 [Nitrospirales bacterium]